MTTRVCSVGDCGVDRYLATGTMYPGGSAANVAVHARRLGARAGYVGLVGDDDAGAHILASVRAEGVDVSRVRRVREPSASTDIALDERGNRSFTAFRPPASRLVLDAGDLDYLAGCAWVHTGHSSFTDAELPRMSGVADLVYDFSYQDLGTAEPLLPFVTVAVFSRAEATDRECLDLIDAAGRSGPSTVVVTRGAGGSVVRAHGEQVVQPAAPAETVDTLGAGDAYLAALLCALDEGRELREATAEAAGYAASVCAYHGAFGHPTPIADPTEEVAT